MAFDWLFFAVLSAFFSAAGVLIDRSVMRDVSDSPAYAQFVQLSGAIVFGVALLWFRPVLSPDWTAWAAGILGGVVWTVFTIRYFETDAKVDATLKRPVFQSRLIFTLALSALFYGEALTLPKMAALGLVCVGVLVAATRDWRGISKLSKDKMFVTLIGLAFLVSIANVYDKHAISVLGVLPYVFCVYAVPAVLTPFAFSRRRERVASLVKKKGWTLLVKSIIEPAGFLSVLLAISTGPVGQVTIVRQISLPLAFIGGVVLLGEKENLKRRGIGAAIVLAGAILAALA